MAGAPPPLFFGLTAAAPVAILVSPNHKDTLHTVAQLRALKRKLGEDDGARARRSAAHELQVR